MKPLRRLLIVIISLLSAIVFVVSMILFIPIQYLFTGRTDILDIEDKIIDKLISRINPDK